MYASLNTPFILHLRQKFRDNTGDVHTTVEERKVWGHMKSCPWPYRVKLTFPFHDPLPPYAQQCYEVTIRKQNLQGLSQIVWDNQTLLPLTSPSEKKGYLTLKVALYDTIQDTKPLEKTKEV